MVSKTSTAADISPSALTDRQWSTRDNTIAVISRSRALIERSEQLVAEYCSDFDQFSLTNVASISLMQKIYAMVDARQFVMKGRSAWLTPDFGDSDYRLGPQDTSIASCLRQSRKQRQLSLAYAAEATGIPEFVLAAYEAGRRRIPHAVIQNLADLYRAART